jgi:spermidine synthase
MTTKLEEQLGPDAGHYLIGEKLLEQGHTGFQSYEVFDTPRFGKLFRLDGFLMLYERDEYLYHENLVHIAGLAHPGPQTALVIGGGDGGTAEELLKYPGMRKVITVELDGKVIDIARQHFASVHRGAFDDPRHELKVQDGLEFVRKDAPAAGLTFDLICLDLTDPVGPSVELYTEKYFSECKAILAPGGALSLHLGPAYYQAERVQELYSRLTRVFGHVTPYSVYIPFYGSQWSFAVASDAVQPASLSEAEVDKRAAERLKDLQFITGATYRAVLAQSPVLQKLLSAPKRSAAA